MNNVVRTSGRVRTVWARSQANAANQARRPPQEQLQLTPRASSAGVSNVRCLLQRARQQDPECAPPTLLRPSGGDSRHRFHATPLVMDGRWPQTSSTCCVLAFRFEQSAVGGFDSAACGLPQIVAADTSRRSDWWALCGIVLSRGLDVAVAQGVAGVRGRKPSIA